MTAEGFQDDVVHWKCATTFGAILAVATDSEVSATDAQRIHGPAILYGFAREHVFDLARRAGIQGAFLPPLNFMSRANP